MSRTARQTTQNLIFSIVLGLLAALMLLFTLSVRVAQGAEAPPVLVFADGLAGTAPAAVDKPAPGAETPSVFATTILPALVRLFTDPTFDGIALGLLALFLRSRHSARADKVLAAIDAGFHIVEDLKAQNKLPAGTAKPVAALEQMNKILALQGVKPTDVEVQLAQAAWQALHGKQAADAPAPTQPTATA